MRICLNPNHNQNFNGIYKIKIQNKDNEFIEFLNNHDFVLRISRPFKENDNKYIYAITSDNYSTEAFFENNLREKHISFQKSLPFVQVLNKKIIDYIFEENKKLLKKKIKAV